MFNFQKEVVINSLDKVAVVKAGGDALGGVPTGIDKKLRVHDGGEYFLKYIKDKTIYQTKAVNGINAKLEIKPEELAGKHVQILVELGLDRDYRGDFGSALWYFRKPILIDVVVPNSVASGTEGVADSYDAAVKCLFDAFSAVIPSEYKFVNVLNKGTYVELECADSYIKVRKVVISQYLGQDEIEDMMTFYGTKATTAEQAKYIVYTRNKTEFGTYEYLLNNLRLPTYANLRFTSTAADEMPIQGAKYTQYSFEYSVPRTGLGGLSVAGQTNISTTLHTLFVNEALTTEFDKMLTAADDTGIGATIVPITKYEEVTRVTVLSDAGASSADLKATKAPAVKVAPITKEESK